MASDLITEAATAFREAHEVVRETDATVEQLASQLRDAEALRDRAVDHVAQCRKALLAACLGESHGK